MMNARWERPPGGLENIHEMASPRSPLSNISDLKSAVQILNGRSVPSSEIPRHRSLRHPPTNRILRRPRYETKSSALPYAQKKHKTPCLPGIHASASPAYTLWQTPGGSHTQIQDGSKAEFHSR